MLALEVAALVAGVFAGLWILVGAVIWFGQNDEVEEARRWMKAYRPGSSSPFQGGSASYERRRFTEARDAYAETLLARRDAWIWPIVLVSGAIDSHRETRTEIAAYRGRQEERRRAEVTKRYEAALKEYEKMKEVESD